MLSLQIFMTPAFQKSAVIVDIACPVIRQYSWKICLFFFLPHALLCSADLCVQ